MTLDPYIWQGLALDPLWLRVVSLDGAPVLAGRCPGCGSWGELDDDQAHGRVSSDCTECPFHETKNWLADHAARLPSDRKSAQ